MIQTRWSGWVVRAAFVASSMGLVVSAQAKERPNFSGLWELLTPELQDAEKQLARTQSLLSRGLANPQQLDIALANVQKYQSTDGYAITQTATSMSVKNSGSMQVFAVYNLDGSESKYTANGAETSAKITWSAGDKLVATETVTQGTTTTQGKRSWSIVAEGLLTVDWATLGPQGDETRTITTVYRLVKAR